MNIRQSAFRGIARCYSSAPPTKPSIALIAELRKQTQVPLSKIREALAHSNNSIPDALLWLEKDMVASGKSKLAKLGSRSTTQGVIAISVLSEGAGFRTAGGVRAAMVELNCETDFVGRNELFTQLASDIAHSAAFISEAKNNTNGDQQVEFNPLSVDELKEAPLIVPSSIGVAKYKGTVHAAIRDTILKVGENISLRRATSIVEDTSLEPPPTTALRLGSYIHGSSQNPSCGRIGALALLSLRSPQFPRLRISKQFRENLFTLERSLARQIIAFPSLKSIRHTPENQDEEALYKQQFITFPGELSNSLVEEALKKWSISEGLVNPDQDDEGSGIDVLRFAHWNVGSEI